MNRQPESQALNMDTQLGELNLASADVHFLTRPTDV